MEKRPYFSPECTLVCLLDSCGLLEPSKRTETNPPTQDGIELGARQLVRMEDGEEFEDDQEQPSYTFNIWED